MVKREHAAVLDTNKMLEKKARDLAQESQQFLLQLMDLKDKQIEKYNEANDLYHEVEKMRQKLELAQLTGDQLKLINDIMSLEKSPPVPEEAKDGEIHADPKPRLDQLRRELLDKVKETAQAAAN